MILPTKEEAEAKYTAAAHDNPRRAYGRGYLRAINEMNSRQVTTTHRGPVHIRVEEETIDDFIELAKSDGIVAAEKWFKRHVKAAFDRAMLGNREDTRNLLESYIADVRSTR